MLQVTRLCPEAKVPTSRAGYYTLCSSQTVRLAPGATVTIRTGLAVTVPPGYVGLVAKVANNSLVGSNDGLRVKDQLISSDCPIEIGVTMTNTSPDVVNILSRSEVAHLILIQTTTLPIETTNWGTAT